MNPIAIMDKQSLEERRIARLRAALKEIQKAEGAYSLDRLVHARNCIENMVNLAEKALALDTELEE